MIQILNTLFLYDFYINFICCVIKRFNDVFAGDCAHDYKELQDRKMLQLRGNQNSIWKNLQHSFKGVLFQFASDFILPKL